MRRRRLTSLTPLFIALAVFTVDPISKASAFTASVQDANISRWTDIAAKLQTAKQTVAESIVILSKDGEPQGCGTIMSADGHILTHSHHTHFYGTEMEVTLSNGQVVRAQVRGRVNVNGMDASALDIIEAGPFPFVEFSTDEELIGKECFLLGYPLGHDFKEGSLMRWGVVRGRSLGQIHTSCRISPGDSGSGLFDLEGKLIGVANSTGNHESSLSTFTGAPAIRELWTAMTYSEAHDVRTPMEWRRELNADEWPNHSKGRSLLVVIRNGQTMVTRGTILHADGWILAKNSEIPARPEVEIVGHTPRPARIIQRFEEHDAAILKVQVQDDAPLNLATPIWNQDPLEQGQVVVAPILRQRLLVGVVGTGQIRRLESPPGTLSIEWSEDATPPTVASVPLQSAAQGLLQKDDKVVLLNHKPIESKEELVQHIESAGLRDGSYINLTIQRGRARKTVRVPLGNSRAVSEGEISLRSSNFNQVFRHDTPVRASECGGPLLNWKGEVVGINIAHSRRHETLALPAKLVQQLLEEAMASEE